MNKRKVLLPIVFSLISVVSCDTKNNNKNIETWSAPATLKMMRDLHNYNLFSLKADIKLGKGETEGAQIGFTPKNDIKEFDVITSDLVGPNGTIKQEDINVFVEKYINITNKTYAQENDNYPTGYTPDMLLPLEAAKIYNETSVGAGQNQSILIEVSTTKDTVPGEYSGNFTLIVDGNKFSFPVNVTVWDIDLSVSRGKNAFGLLSVQGIQGDLSNTEENYINNYETLLNDYRMNCYYLPGWDKGAVEMAESAAYYFNNPNFTCYNIPMFEPRHLYSGMADEMFQQYVEEIVRHSTNEMDLMSKAVCYLSLADEPFSDAQAKAAVQLAKDVKENLAIAIEKLESEGTFNKFSSEIATKIKYEITNLPLILTCYYKPVFEGIMNAYCPKISECDSDDERELYARLAKESNGEQWWYYCMDPIYPYPSLDIDDYLIGNRIRSWMQKDYGVAGHLYYATNFYWNFTTQSYINPYENPYRFQTATGYYPGDGYVTYPGKKYGYDHPLGSIRTVAIRDGEEDYNMLCAICDELDILEKEYAVEDLESSLDRIYKTIYTGTVYNPSDESFYQARDEAYEFYRNVKDDGLVIGDAANIGDTQVFTMYTKAGTTLKINGIPVEGSVSGNGLVFSHVTKLDKVNNDLDLEIITNGKTITKHIVGNKMTSKATLFDQNSLDNITSSDDTTISVESGKLLAKFVSKGETMIEKMTFNPSISFGKELFDNNFENVDTITINVKNNSTQKVTLYVNLEDEQLDTVTLNAGQSKQLIVKGVYENKAISYASDLVIYVDNIDTNGNLLQNRDLVFEEIYYTKRG